jgi:hypothetical protein
MSLSDVALPKELSPGLSEAQTPAGVSSNYVKVVPSNVTTIVSPEYTLSASSYQNIPFTSQDIIFDVPAGQGDSVFLDSRFSTLSFKATYTVTSAGSSQVVTNAYLRSGCMSFFDRTTTTSSSGLVLDDIPQLGLVADTIGQLEVDIAQRDCLAQIMGYLPEDQGASSQNNNQGHAIPSLVHATAVVAGSSYYSYCPPLINSLIGVGSKKWFHIGKVPKLQVRLTTSSVLPLTMLTGAATTAAKIQVTLSDFALNLCYIDIGSEGVKLLPKSGASYYNGITYRVSSSTLPAGSGSTQSILTGLKGSSVRSIISRFNDAGAALSNATSANGIYDSKMPLVTSINYNVNGVRQPSNPHNPVNAPASCFSALQQCNSRFSPLDMKSSIIPQRYCVFVPTGGTPPANKDAYITTSQTVSTSLASFMYGLNLEKISKKDGIMSGSNLNAGQTFLEFSFAGDNTFSTNNTIYFIAKQDIIYVLNEVDGDLMVRM